MSSNDTIPPLMGVATNSCVIVLDGRSPKFGCSCRFESDDRCTAVALMHNLIIDKLICHLLVMNG